jgi:hypothetical protein
MAAVKNFIDIHEPQLEKPMNRRIYLQIFTILVLASCGPQTPVPSAPPLLPTGTALVKPTSGPIQVETPGKEFYFSGEPVGFIVIPGVGDAGNFFLDAGSTVTLLWNDPPLDAARYDFAMLDASGLPVLIGTDIEPADGVSAQWLVPANLPGYEVGGTAYSAKGEAVYFARGGTVYSHEAPPQNICTLSNNTIGAIPLHIEPNPSSQIFADLIPGRYVQVYEYIPDGWYRIDAGKLEVYNNTTLMCGESPASPCRGYSDSITGWVQARDGVKLFGPCDQFSFLDEPEQNRNPVSSPASTPSGDPTLFPAITYPTEISTTSPTTEYSSSIPLIYFGSSVFDGIEARKKGCERAYARSQSFFRYFSRSKR